MNPSSLIRRICLTLIRSRCSWHKGDEPFDWADPYGCLGCGSLYQTAECSRCGRHFLDWESESFDDVMVAPRVTPSGDLTCVRCIDSYRDEEYAPDNIRFCPWCGVDLTSLTGPEQEPPTP